MVHSMSKAKRSFFGGLHKKPLGSQGRSFLNVFADRSPEMKKFTHSKVLPVLVSVNIDDVD